MDFNFLFQKYVGIVALPDIFGSFSMVFILFILISELY